MGSAYFIATSDESGTFDAFVNGKAIARSSSLINEYAKELGIASLEDLVSYSEDEIQGLMEDAGMEEPPAWYKGEKWFDADDGLEWVRALKQRISRDMDLNEQAEAVLAELSEYESVLKQIKDRSLQWHLAIDY